MDLISRHPFLASLGAIGLLKLGSYALEIIKLSYEYILNPGLDLMELYGKCWATVTGATGGIGEAFCWHLAKLGFNVLLVGRDTNKLSELGAKISDQFPDIEVRSFKVDFLKDISREWMEKLSEIVRSYDIGIYINTAGVANALEFQSIPPHQIEELIAITVVGNCFFSKILVQKMLTRERRSAILNISSINSFGKYPYCGIYNGTRAFLDSFATSLNAEAKGKIDITTIQCGNVLTKMNPQKTVWHISPTDAVQAHLSLLGKRTNSFGHWKHFLQKKILTSFLGSWYKNMRMRELNEQAKKKLNLL